MVRSETVAQPATAATGADDQRAAALGAAVDRVRRELAAHPAELPDRAAAEDELALLDAIVTRGVPEIGRLRGSLLLVAAALGSVSALAGSLAGLREAVEAFGGSSLEGSP